MSPQDPIAATFLTRRAEWKAVGCPTDHPYARECAATAARLEGSCAWCGDDFYSLDAGGVCVGCRDGAAREEAERWAQDR